MTKSDEKELLDLIKNMSIKDNLNPIIYYGIKCLVYEKFRNKSKYFCEAIMWLFTNVNCPFESNLIFNATNEPKASYEDSLKVDLLQLKTNVNNTENKMCINLVKGKSTDTPKSETNSKTNNDNFSDKANIDMLLSYGITNLEEIMKNLFYYCNDYILDRNDDYILLNLIKSYIFSDEDSSSSNLMISYNIYSSSIELIFCLKLVEYFPIPICNSTKEEKYYNDYIGSIQDKVNAFFNSWIELYAHKYQNNILIKYLLEKNVIKKKQKLTGLDLKSLAKKEPNLPLKNVAFARLIRDGIFVFEIEEIARQFCIIDQELIKEMTLFEITNFTKKNGKSDYFNKIILRNKQLKCYILLFILMQNNLENKKLMTENFILLANGCRLLHNYQSSYTIISAFNLIGITKKLFWRQIEKRFKDLYCSLEKDYLEVELKDFFQKDRENIVFPRIPNFVNIFLKMDSFINKSNKDSINKTILSKEFKDFNILMRELSYNKYPFFKVNPLHDFLKFGFLEIFKSKIWDIKVLDFSKFIEQNPIDSVIEVLVSNLTKILK